MSDKPDPFWAAAGMLESAGKALREPAGRPDGDDPEAARVWLSGLDDVRRAMLEAGIELETAGRVLREEAERLKELGR